jgi:hypothetical protein
VRSFLGVLNHSRDECGLAVQRYRAILDTVHFGRTGGGRGELPPASLRHTLLFRDFRIASAPEQSSLSSSFLCVATSFRWGSKLTTAWMVARLRYCQKTCVSDGQSEVDEQDRTRRGCWGVEVPPSRSNCS